MAKVDTLGVVQWLQLFNATAGLLQKPADDIGRINHFTGFLLADIKNALMDLRRCIEDNEL
jgi:hypothetical protein